MNDELTAAVARLRAAEFSPLQQRANDLELILSALEAAQAAMPPREATDAMTDAGCRELYSGRGMPSDIWRAMYDAWAQEQTSVAGEQSAPQAGTEPGAAAALDPIADLVRRLLEHRNHTHDCEAAADCWDAADALERLARANADESARHEFTASRMKHEADCRDRAEAERDALRAELGNLAAILRVNILRLEPKATHTEIDAIIDAARAKQLERERDEQHRLAIALWEYMVAADERAERADAQRDALREFVRAVDAMRDKGLRDATCRAYDAARAKLEDKL